MACYIAATDPYSVDDDGMPLRVCDPQRGLWATCEIASLVGLFMNELCFLTVNRTPTVVSRPALSFSAPCGRWVHILAEQLNGAQCG